MNVSLIPVFAILLLTASGTFGQKECSESDIGEVQKCYKNFFAKLQITSMPSFENYMVTIRKLLDDDGIKNVAQFRQWILARMTCIKPYEPQCLTVEVIPRVFKTDNATEVREWFTIHALEDWEFTEGYDQLVKNYGCFRTLEKEHLSEIEKCSKDFEAAIQKGFSCSVVNDFISCLTDLYQQNCGPSGGDFMCKAMTLSMVLNFPKCKGSTPKCPGKPQN